MIRMCYNHFMEKLDKNTLGARWLLILICLAITCTCYYRLNQSYDPLARYQYATDKNREIILEYLDSDDIDYMISQNIKPKQYMDFINVEGFDIHNTVYYEVAKETQDEEPEYIVNFVNKYKDNFTKDSLADLLTNYTYLDLTTFYEDQIAMNSQLRIVSKPNYDFLTLNTTHSVYHYQPSDLVEVENIQVRSKVKNDLENLLEDYQNTMNASLELQVGYMSFSDISTDYVSYQESYPDLVDEMYLPAGQNELQLGYTIFLSNASVWNDLCYQCLDNGTVDYDLVEEQLTEEQQEQIVWLEENAYQYGFVIRYPQNKEKQTNMIYQPFVLRYVGKKAAKAMDSSHDCMEEMKFDSESI